MLFNIFSASGQGSLVSSTRSLLLAVVLVVSNMQPSYAAGLPDSGKAIAEHWCASCHLVKEDQPETTTDTPTFRSIARKTETTDWIAGFLADPHPPMPNLSLTRQEIQDLGAYFESLRQK